MNIKEMEKYISGLRRSVSILTFFFFIVLMTAYLVSLNVGWALLGEASIYLVVLMVTVVTVFFSLVLVTLALPVLQFESAIDELEEKLDRPPGES